MVVALLYVSLVPITAFGTSCIGLHPRNDIENIDAAFEGTITGARPTMMGTVYTAAVDVDLRRNLPPIVTFVARRSGLAALFPESPLRVGSQVALPLFSDGLRWYGGRTCGGPYRLGEVRRAAQPLPAPIPGPLRFVITGRLGDITTIGLGRGGEIRAYGLEGGSVPSICPGAGWMIEIGFQDRDDGREPDHFLVRRRLSTFTSWRSVPLKPIRLGGHWTRGFIGTSCVDPAGRTAFGSAASDEDLIAFTRISADGAQPIYRGRFPAWALAGKMAFAVDHNGRLQRLDLATRRRTTLASGWHRTVAIGISPDQREIATVEIVDDRAPLLTIRSLRSPDRIRAQGRMLASIPDYELRASRLEWLDSTRLAHVFGITRDLYGPDARPLGRAQGLEYRAKPIALGNRLFSLRGDQEDVTDLVRVFANGRTRSIADLPSPALFSIVAIPLEEHVPVHQRTPPRGIIPKGLRLSATVSYGFDIWIAWTVLLAGVVLLIVLLRFIYRKVRPR